MHRHDMNLPIDRSTPTAGRGARDLRGVSRLVIDAITGVTDIVEDMHRTIAGGAPIVGALPAGRARGISGLVYRSVRGITRAVGVGIDAAIVGIEPLLGTQDIPHGEALRAALNGVLGDRLAQADSPLAIPMSLRHDGRALDPARAFAGLQAPAQPRVLVMIHGLCMTDLQWRRDGHDHGAALAAELGASVLYLHYNSGRRISDNGDELADLLERLVADWPVPISELMIVGHSMGGLLARSACHVAAQRGQAWLSRLRKLVFLGTPHHGAPLERAGHRIDRALALSPYSSPIARLGNIRSAGVKDLRHGIFVDTQPGTSAASGDRDAARIELPDGVDCYAVAASRSARAPRDGVARGDGLVPVASALGRHRDPVRQLGIPAERQFICYDAHHFDLLSRGDVYQRLRDWLGGAADTA